MIAPAKPGVPLSERFWARVERGPSNDCWEWLGYRKPNGYGSFAWKLGGGGHRTQLAHRLAYELLVGPIPEGHELDHLCHNRGCVNPAHLEAVTRIEHMRRSKAFIARGVEHYNSVKTHCAQGHPFDEENTHLRPDGRRRCRACDRAYWRARKYGVVPIAMLEQWLAALVEAAAA